MTDKKTLAEKYKGIEFKSSGTARAFFSAGMTFFILWVSCLPFLLFTVPGVGFLIASFGAVIAYLGGAIIFSRYRYCILPDRILLRHGVISRNYLDIPMIRVQSVFINQTIVERMFGVGSLHIQTAGALDWEAWIYSIKNYDSIGNYILEKSEEARLAQDVPRMARASPDPKTVRVLNKVERGISKVFGKTDPHLKVGSQAVMNKKFHMSPKMITVWTLEAVVILMVAWGFLWIGYVLFPGPLYGSFILLWLVMFLVTARTYAVLNFNNYTFHFDRDALTIRHGILYKYRRKLPYKRIQNVNIFSTFFGRMLGLHSIVVETAGGWGHIHGIEEPDAAVYFLLEHAEDARFDDALGDAAELEDYHLKLLKQTKKINYRMKERLGEYENPFDQSTPEFKGKAVMDERTESFFIARTFLQSQAVFNFVAMFFILSVIIIFPSPMLFIGWFLILLVFTPFAAVYSIWYGKSLFESYVLRFDYDSMFSRYGVWTINDEMVPYRRIQNSYVHQGILMRMFGIKSVMIHAPGMYRWIPGLRDPYSLVGFTLRKAEEARVDEAHEMEANVVTEIALELREMDDLLLGYMKKHKRKRRLVSKA